MENMAHGSNVSVVDLDTETKRPADVVVELTARQGKVRIASGKTVEGYSLNDRSPGPLIEATVGQLVEVRLHNESVKGGVALHWHGVDVPNAQDGVAGVTQDAVAVGEDHIYRWIAPDAGSYWYHSHQLSNEQVIGGLFGGIIVHPKEREAEVGDVMAMAHLYDERPHDRRAHGLTACHGPAGAAGASPAGQHRQRSAERLVGNALPGARDRRRRRARTDRGPRPVDRHPGGRSGRPRGAGADGRHCGARRDVRAKSGSSSARRAASAASVEQPKGELDLLDYGSSGDVGFDTAQPDRKFEYSVGRRPGFLNGKPGLWWSVNGKLYPDMPMFVVSEGDVVRVRISNHSGESHPMHLHGHHAVVLSRDGVKASGSPWWFDSLEVENGQTFDIAFVADNPGLWMDHCHNLKHATEGLVTHLMYDGVTTPYRLGSDSGNIPE